MPCKTIVIENLSALQGGGQTYLLNLMRHIPDSLLNEVRIVAIIPQSLAPKLRIDSRVHVLTPEPAQHGLLQRIAWLRRSLPQLLQDLQTDVLYCPGGSLSARSASFRKVVAFRNMLPFAQSNQWRYPLGYQRLRNFLLRRTQSRSFRDADKVIFISEHAKAVIDRTVPKRCGGSVVIPHGVGALFRRAAPRPEDIVGEREYCLYVSTFDYYKAQLEVVEAWARLRKQRETPERLILVGSANASYRRKVEALIRQLQLQEEVLVLDAVPYERLPAIYQHAKINIFASACENCPNILLEALASGRPVLCSSAPPMPEFGGDGVAYFDPFRPDELAQRLLELIDDREMQHRMSAAAKQRSTRYDWQRSAEQTWSLLASLARKQ